MLVTGRRQLYPPVAPYVTVRDFGSCPKVDDPCLQSGLGVLQGPACLFVLLAQSARAEPPRTDDHGDPLPPGAVARLGTVRLRHVVRDGSGAACVAFSLDGKTLVSGGDVGLCAWDAATGKNLGWFSTPSSATAALFTADGKALLTTDNIGSILLWQAGTGKLLRETKQPQDNQFFQGLGSYLSANGEVAGVIGLEGGIRFWKTETGKEIMARKEEGQGLFFSAALSPDAKTLVLGGQGNRALLLEVPTGKEIRPIEGPNKAPPIRRGRCPTGWAALYWFRHFSPDGKILAGGCPGKDSFSVSWMSLTAISVTPSRTVSACWRSHRMVNIWSAAARWRCELYKAAHRR